MAVTIRLKDFTPKVSPVPADLVYLGNSADSFNEVQSTIAEIFGAYANLNLPANNFIPKFTTTATAAGTTTLTVNSTYFQYFTGSTTQTVVMPVVSTLVQGQSWFIVNNSTGAVTVNSSGGNLIQVMPANTSLLVTCQLITGTTAASWNSTLQTDTAAGGLKSFQVFTSGTAATYTTPVGISSILVEVVGAGGGGGSVVTTGTLVGAAGGGGGGGYARLWVPIAASSYTYTVGGGGAGGGAGAAANGSTGGTTTFSASSLQATGGTGGQGSTGVATTGAQANSGGQPGIGSNGNVNVAGMPSTFGWAVLAIKASGNGGASLFGGGARGTPADAAGANGNSAGGGGAGATCSGVAGFAGGNGANGMIIVWEFS